MRLKRRDNFALAALLARDPIASQLHQTHLLVLEKVCASEKPLTAGVIAPQVGISLSQLSRLLATLERHDLITRTDTYPSLTQATEAGRAMIQRINAYVESCLSVRAA